MIQIVSDNQYSANKIYITSEKPVILDDQKILLVIYNQDRYIKEKIIVNKSKALIIDFYTVYKNGYKNGKKI